MTTNHEERIPSPLEVLFSDSDRILGAVEAPSPSRAFGEANRRRLISRHFDGSDEIPPREAWRHVYRLLLWVDRTTGLAHCYESDKTQPGRPWYARSLAFHVWLADEFAVSPRRLSSEIDLLFREAVTDLTRAENARRALRDRDGTRQRAKYGKLELPLPGEDAEIERLILDVFGPILLSEPGADELRSLTREIRASIALENKRKNLVGEGFEDCLGAILERIDAIRSGYDVSVRNNLDLVPGFHPPRGREKAKQVDLVLVRKRDGYRTLVSCKWSVRSDREEQFMSDYRAYVELESAGQDFDYVLVTNEFDPARLAAACDARWQNGELFTRVVHVNPHGPTAAYAALANRSPGRGQSVASERIASGRLGSLEGWIEEMIAAS